MGKNKIAAFVRHRRKSQGLSQAQLAERAGVGMRFVRELERGKPSVRCDKVEQVLALFGHTLGPVPVDRDELLGASDDD